MKKLSTAATALPSSTSDLAKDIPSDARLCWFQLNSGRVQTDSTALAPAWCVKIESAILEILESDVHAGNAHQTVKDATFVLALDASQLSDEPNLRSTDELKKNLLILLKAVLGPTPRKEGLVLADRRAGQLQGTMLRLEAGADIQSLVKTIRDRVRVLNKAAGSARQEAQRKIAEAMAEFAARLPRTYHEEHDGLVTVFAVLRKEFAAILEPAINAYAATMPQATYEDKKDLAKWVNAQLRVLGVAIKDPKSGKPCHLVGSPGNRPGIGRFMLNHRDADGKLVHSVTSVDLPHLELMADNLARASHVQGTSRSR